MITLTVNEIYDLARFAGLAPAESERPDEDEGEMTITIANGPEKGILDESDNVVRRYRLIAFLDEYPEEGVYGLGSEIEANIAGLPTRDERAANPSK